MWQWACIHSELVYNEKSFKTKLKSSEGKLHTAFHYDKTPKEGSWYICLSDTLIAYVFKMDKSHSPEVFSEECKYIAKKKK